MRLLLLLALLLLGSPAATAENRIALTFDDVPRQRGAFFTPGERTRRLFTELKRGGVRQAAFFVTPGGWNIEAPAWEKGLPAPRWYQRLNPKVANPLFEQRVLHAAPAA